MGHLNATRIFLLFAAFSLVGGPFLSTAFAQPPTLLPNTKQPLYRQGELLVKFRVEAGRAAADQHSAVGAAVMRRFAAGRIDMVKLAEGMSVERALELYRGNPLVERAEPNYLVYRAQIPNDPNFVQQWALHNTGQQVQGSGGNPGADVHAPSAWDRHTGSGSIIVATLDTGVDYGHPDLAANIWMNAADPQDGRDNDGNGYVDDVRGWNFVAKNNDPLDDDTSFSHGTHVAGVIGAVGNNAMGVSGINWSVRIMPLKVLNGDGIGALTDIIAAIDYAIAKGAKVINASYTYPQGCVTLPSGPSTFEREAIERARDAGVVFAAAAGNYSCDNNIYPFYPASHPVANILSVAATDSGDRLVAFSNAGEHSVYLGAPGTNIFSTVRRASGEYGYLSGTSMAAPMVAGAAALLASYRPALQGEAIREILLKAVTPLPALGGQVMSGGRLDLAAAMDRDLALETPFQPAFLSAVRRSAVQIDLGWVDNSTVEDRFELERKVGIGGQYDSVAGSLPANTAAYSDTGVNAVEGTAYYYRVRAGNGNGTSRYSNEAAVLTPPNAPTGLTAAANAGKISLSWTDNSAVEDGFQIERQAGGEPFSLIATIPSNTTQFTDAAAAPATTYVYQVRAFAAAAGFSDYATSVPVTTATQSTGGDGGGGGGCFIATAAYGSALHPKVALLRQFRDQYLMTTPLGRWFVSLYYRVSPPLARVIAANKALRTVVRAGLTPVVWMVELAMSGPPPKKPGQGAAPSRVEGELLIKFRKGVSRERAEELVRAQGAAVDRYLDPAGLYVVKLPADADVEESVRSFSRLNEVERAEPNIRVSR